MSSTTRLPDGLVAVVKRSCPTCELVVPVLETLAAGDQPLTVYSQDDPTFPDGVGAFDDRDLEISYRHKILTVPTLLKVAAGQVTARTEGWYRADWEELSGQSNLGPDLPSSKPGCGSLSEEPGIAERLEARHGTTLQARRLEIGDQEDPFEALYERGFTDGLPVVPPTPERVVGMLSGTSRDASEIIGVLPPNMAPCSVEKAAINAVMAGCKPEYFPVVLAALEAACREEFGLHGLLATTLSHGPILIVNGPVADRIGMNSGLNALGQGNRANATIGRALQLIVRNVGGGRPAARPNTPAASLRTRLIHRVAVKAPGWLSISYREIPTR